MYLVITISGKCFNVSGCIMNADDTQTGWTRHPTKTYWKRKYLSEYKQCMFEFGRFEYELDLKNMCQKNKTTGAIRPIRRRPVSQQR
jgi:hypothetical protein